MNKYKISIGPQLTGKIPYGHDYWRTFNASFENVELEPFQIGEALFSGKPITTWHKNHWRKGENYQLGQHLGADFDTEDERSTIDNLLAQPFIARYASLLYTTPSNTIEAPRARVVFLLDTPIHQAKNYVDAVTALLFVLNTADRQCKDSVRFFYGCGDTSAPGFQIEITDNVLPLDVVKRMMRDHSRIASMQRQPRTGMVFSPSTVDEQEIAEALKKINPMGIDYDEWLSVLMAVHAELGDRGLEVAEAWAYGKPGEIARKWRSFNSAGNTRGRIGAGTLFQLAKTA